MGKEQCRQHDGLHSTLDGSLFLPLTDRKVLRGRGEKPPHKNNSLYNTISKLPPCWPEDTRCSPSPSARWTSEISLEACPVLQTSRCCRSTPSLLGSHNSMCSIWKCLAVCQRRLSLLPQPGATCFQASGLDWSDGPQFLNLQSAESGFDPTRLGQQLPESVHFFPIWV